ncbi:MAG TPA: tRNA pseudouridine(55) synthase TruB [Candidatus Limnocylindria bacterium]|nr:tRNA pseudouridine(55) synthase TruB [Candidatus Limnocylindria bacterium]
MEGILSVDKPAGWTSHDVVAVCRGASRARRVGHGGTLDPLATGVLPVLFGGATRFVARLHTAPKVYGALVVFGTETGTDDRAGAVTRKAPAPELAAADLDAALAPFRGDIEQVPPAHSAVKVAGRRAYARARAGEPLDLSARRVRVDRLAIASWETPRLELLVVCSSGTYVRSLARDIGRALGSAAHLGSLVRLAVGALTLEGSVDIERIRRSTADEIGALLCPADDRLLPLPERYLRDDPRGLVRTVAA